MKGKDSQSLQILQSLTEYETTIFAAFNEIKEELKISSGNRKLYKVIQQLKKNKVKLLETNNNQI